MEKGNVFTFHDSWLNLAMGDVSLGNLSLFVSKILKPGTSSGAHEKIGLTNWQTGKSINF